MSTATLWEACAVGDVDARAALLQENLSLVYHVARGLARSLATTAQFEELVSSGTIGLMSAVEAFDPSLGLAFSTFAVPRIRGAILDELRRQDHVPRSVRRKSRDVSAAVDGLASALGRPATECEVADHLGVPLDTLWRWKADTQGSVHVSLDTSPVDAGETAATREELTAEESESVLDLLAREDETARLQEALAGLRDQERTVLTLYYFEELKLHEIAEILGVTESRVSQVRAKAIGHLRRRMQTPRRVQVIS